MYLYICSNMIQEGRQNGQMKRLFTKDQILTIPNFLSLFRIILIPLILWAHFALESPAISFSLILISGLTDIVDGAIARHFNMISDLGKILDPIADKLTQLSLMCCFLSQYDWMFSLLLLFIFKEIIMGVCGLITLKKKDAVNSAQWFGKLNTLMLYGTMILFVLFPAISQTTAKLLIGLCISTNILALVKYLLFYISILSPAGQNN